MLSRLDFGIPSILANVIYKHRDGYMNQEDLFGLIQLTDLFLKDSKHEGLLNQLGVSIVDNNSQTPLTKGIWKSISIDQIPYCGNSWISQLHPEDRSRVKQSQRAIHQGSVNISSDNYRICDKKGNWHWISNTIGVLIRNEDGTPWITICIDKDITKSKLEEEAIEQRLWEADVLNSTTEVIISSLNLDDTVKRVLDQAKLLVPYDQAMVQVLHDGFLEVIGGVGFDDIEKYTGLNHPFPEEDSLSTRAIREHRPWKSDDVTLDFPTYVQLGDGNNTIRSSLGVPLIAHGDVIGLLTFDSKQTNFYTDKHLKIAQAFSSPVAIALENARMHGDTYQLVMQDALTGVGSRYAFDLNSKYFFEKAKREDRIISIAMLDLDWFKKINDDFGHLAGDKLLRIVCQTCDKSLRTTDFIARYGGDEIVILFPDTSPETSEKIVSRICRDVSMLTFEKIDRPVTLSAGIYGSQIVKNTSLEEFLHNADKALYQSKKNGRNRITIFRGSA